MDNSKYTKKYNVYGEQLSYDDLKEFPTVHKFFNTSHDKRSIVQDPNGTYYLYDFHEEMGFPNDWIVEHFFVLDNLEQGLLHENSSMLNLKTEFRKFIHIAPDVSITVNG